MLIGALCIMAFDGIDFGTAFAVSIASLGNIGPAFVVGKINAGAAGNYSSFTLISKMIMI
jgi:hypothetical protein